MLSDDALQAKLADLANPRKQVENKQIISDYLKTYDKKLTTLNETISKAKESFEKKRIKLPANLTPVQLFDNLSNLCSHTDDIQTLLAQAETIVTSHLNDVQGFLTKIGPNAKHINTYDPIIKPYEKFAGSVKKLIQLLGAIRQSVNSFHNTDTDDEKSDRFNEPANSLQHDKNAIDRSHTASGATTGSKKTPQQILEKIIKDLCRLYFG